MCPHVTAKKNGWTDESVKKGGRDAIKYKHSQRVHCYRSMDQDAVPWSFQISRGISGMILLAQQRRWPFSPPARSSSKTSDHTPRRGKQLLGNIRTCPFCLGRISVGGYTFIHLRRLLYSLTESYDHCLIQNSLLGYLIDLVCFWLLIWFLFYFPFTYFLSIFIHLLPKHGRETSNQFFIRRQHP